MLWRWPESGGARGSARIALTGDADARLLRDGEATPSRHGAASRSSPATSFVCSAAVATAQVTLAVAGLEYPPQMGSAATYARAGLGGLDGQPLQAGARLNAADAAGKAEMVAAQASRA